MAGEQVGDHPLTSGRSRLEVRVLGPLEVVIDGVTVAVGSPKQRVLLLRLLVARGRAVSTDALVEAVWPEDRPGSPSASLRSYLSNLRRLLGSGADDAAIERRSKAYVLRLPAGALDVDRFESALSSARDATDPALRLARAERALAHWRGRPLADAGEHEFTRSASASWSALRREAREIRTGALIDLGRLGEAIAAAEEALAEDPLAEGVWEQLMVALYRFGRQADALRAFVRARDVLREHLGVEPGPRLREVERRILDHDLDPIVVSSVAARRLGWTSGSEPLVGRDPELGTLRRFLDDVAGGSSGVTCISGEPGAGKTRLVEVAVERYGTAARPVRIRCDPTAVGAGILPLLTGLRELLETIDREDAERVLGADRDLPWGLVPWESRSAGAEPDVDDAARFRLFAALVGFLGRLAEDRPVVLVVDDLHWAGPRLVEFLVFLAAQRTEAPVAVVVTLRPGEIAPEVATMTARLTRSLGSINIEVGELDRESIETLVADRLGRPAAELAHAVHRRSGGNAYFAVELIRAVDPDRLDASMRHGPPPGSLREVILARVSELPGRSDALLTAGALCGATFDLSIVSAAAECDHTEAADIVDAAIAAGLLREVGERPGQLEFRHALVRDAVEHGVTRVRRAHWHARIGEVLLARGAIDDPAAVVDLTAHLAAGAIAGTGLAAGITARRAIDAALARHESGDAADLAVRALAALDHVEDRPERRSVEAELWCDLATARKRMADVTGSHEASRRGFSVARSNDDIETMARAALCLAGGPSSAPWQAYWTPAAEAVELLDATLGAANASELDPGQMVLLLAAVASCRSEIGAMASAWEAADEAVALSRRLDSPRHRALAVLERWRLADVEGSATDRRSIAEEAVAVASVSVSKTLAEEAVASVSVSVSKTLAEEAVAVASVSETLAEEAMGRRQLVVVEIEAAAATAAADQLDRLEALGIDARSEQIEFDVAFLRTALALFRGDLAEAERRLTDSLERFAHLDEGRLDVFELQLVRLLYERGQLHTVEDRFRERLAEQDSPALRAPLLLLLAEHDRAAEAREMLATMPASDFAGVAEPPVQFVSLCLLADAAAELDATEHARRLVEVLEPLADRMISLSTGVLLNGWVAMPLARILALTGRCDDAERWAGWAADRARLAGSPLFELRARITSLEVELRRGIDVSSRVGPLADEAAAAGYDAVLAWLDRLSRRPGAAC